MRFLEELARDARLAVRSLRRAPAFAAAVVLTLALGIGANATVFALVDAVVLRPVAGVREPERLFELADVVSYPALRDLAAREPALRLAGVSERRIALGAGAGGGAEHTTGALVAGPFFAVAGVRAAVGRVLDARDDAPGAAPVAVLTHEHWRRAFGGDSAVVGRTVTVNGAPVPVVGVAAAGFRGVHLGRVPAVWLPARAWTAVRPTGRASELESRNWEWLSVVGRLPDGVTLAEAHARLAAAMAADAPDARRADLLERTAPRPAQAAALPGDARAGVVRFAALLAGAVGLVLLTACANIAGLMLARAAYREREIGVRVAIGAGRARLARQLLTEALVLAAGGGAAGVALYLLTRALLARAELPGGMPGSAIRLEADPRLLLVAVGLTLLTGLLVGLAPAVQASRPDTVSALKGAGTRPGGRRHALRGALVTAQVAVALTLLVGTGLFARALGRALAVDLGFRPAPLATLVVDPGLARLDPARAPAYYAAVAARVAAVPGVSGAAWSGGGLLSGDMDRERATIPGYTPARGERMYVEWGLVGPRYHEVMGIPLLAGRGLEERDAAGATPVVVVNETLARRYFPRGDAVGRYVTMREVPLLIVGVARDATYHELGEAPRPYAYLPMLQAGAGGVGAATLVVRAAGDPASLLAAAAEAARSVDPAVPVFAAATASDRLREVLAPQRAGAWALGVFGALALLVATVGVWGVVAHAVSQRGREIGIRLALGASRRGVVRHVVAAHAGVVLAGIPIGLALAAALGRAAARFLFGVGAADPVALAGASLLVLGVALLASWLPARRTARIDPLAALRAESVLLAAAAGALAGATAAPRAATAQAPPAAVSARAVAAVASRGLPARADTFDLFVGEPGRRALGHYVYAVAASTAGGRPAYLVTMRFFDGPGRPASQGDTLAVDAATLAPLWHRLHMRHDSAAARYDGRRVSGWTVREGGGRVAIDRRLAEDAVDGALVRWLLPTLPLAAGYRASITTYGMWRDAEQTSTLAVVGSERVPFRGGSVDAWVVESSGGMRRWIDRATGETVRQHEPDVLGGRGAWLVRR